MQILRHASANALVLVLALGGSWALSSQDSPEPSSRRAVSVPQEARSGGAPGVQEAQVTPVNLPGAVPIGAIVAHALDVPGAAGLGALRELGFAVCNGTTPAFQGIDDAVMAGPTPDLNDSGRFLRGADPGYTGLLQDDATDANGLGTLITDPGHDHVTLISDFNYQYNGADSSGTGYPDFGSSYMYGTYRRTHWDAEAYGASGFYHTTPGATGITAAITSTDPETRPSNMSVLWIMRVK